MKNKYKIDILIESTTDADFTEDELLELDQFKNRFDEFLKTSRPKITNITVVARARIDDGTPFLNKFSGNGE